jgi:hypothetical protein
MRLIIVISLLLSACGSPKGSPEAFLERQEEAREARVEEVEKAIDDLPSWFTDVPQEDNAIFSVGSATSPDLQLAMDKSILNAKRMLADRIEGRLSSQVKEYITETGNKSAPPVITDTERVTKNIMREVNVAGYSVKEMEIKPHNTFFRVYTMLIYPVGKANQLLELYKERVVNRTKQGKINQGYKELDRNVKRKTL